MADDKLPITIRVTRNYHFLDSRIRDKNLNHTIEVFITNKIHPSLKFCTRTKDQELTIYENVLALRLFITKGQYNIEKVCVGNKLYHTDTDYDPNMIHAYSKQLFEKQIEVGRMFSCYHRKLPIQLNNDKKLVFCYFSMVNAGGYFGIIEFYNSQTDNRINYGQKHTGNIEYMVNYFKIVHQKTMEDEELLSLKVENNALVMTLNKKTYILMRPNTSKDSDNNSDDKKPIKLFKHELEEMDIINQIEKNRQNILNALRLQTRVIEF